MTPVVTTNPQVMSGQPCFAGTRVTVRTFFDHLDAGYTVPGFLAQFPTVRPEQMAAVLAPNTAAAVPVGQPADEGP